MLILTRREGEEIDIGPNIRIKIIELRRESVRLGFVAPDDVQIMRSELLQQIRFALADQSVAVTVEPEPGATKK